MDATTTSPQVPSKFSDVCNLLYESKNKTFTPTLVRKNTIVKYAKLPNYEFKSKASWRQPENYVLPVKLRKIIALEDEDLTSTHTEIQVPVKFITTKHTMRKTVAITDQDDARQITRFQKTSSARYSHRSVGNDNDKANPIKTSTRTITKSNKKLDRTGVKSASWNSNRDVVPKNDRGKIEKNNYKEISQDAKYQNTYTKGKQNIHLSGHNSPSKVSVSKSMMPPNVNEPDLCHIKSKLTATIFRSEMSSKKAVLRPKSATLTSKPCKVSEIVKNNKGVVGIHGPSDNTNTKKMPRQMRLQKFTRQNPMESAKNECGMETDRNMYITKEVIVQTQEPKATATQTMEIEMIDSKISEINEEISDLKVISYDCLDTPNIKLTKDRKCTPKENIVSIDHRQSLSTLELRPFQVIPTEEANFDNENSNKKIHEMLLKLNLATLESQTLKNIPTEEVKNDDSLQNSPELILERNLSCLESPPLRKSPTKDDNNRNEDRTQRSPLLIDNEGSPQLNPSIIISRHTLTYTTKQEINMDLGNRIKETSPLDHSISSLSPSLLDYPLNVMTVYKSENMNRPSKVSTAYTEKTQTTKEKAIQIEHMNHHKENTASKCTSPYVSCKLIKPSEIISTIRVNTGLLQNDYICQQFERELNFIDSFFESLQYLENCSLSDKCADDKVENWVNNSGFGNPEYDSLFSNLENGPATDTETMASKSLCLLNLLIRDEQRRARNLLFVLKMREDALKDFTKSQILWLENKKKLENTDISTLKKKQRGALLKLQHECGEMQRMRKALLALSEKRKVALMKTKNNIELKLKNNVTVDQILLGKKKLKRSTITDRIAPLKCFDLSSSGCDDVTPPRARSDTHLLSLERTKIPANIAEKCVQTGDSLLGSALVDSATDTAAENFVTVDGSYLNILFQNTSLPQIFSAGKQYEVNEAALKNILNSNSYIKNSCESDVIDKFMDQIKNRDHDSAPSSPSTARSLVEELDQYYKGLADEDKLPLLLLEENVSTLDLLKENPLVEIKEMEICASPTVSHLNLEAAVYDVHKVDIVPENSLSTVMDVINESDNKPMLDEEQPLTSCGMLTGPLPVPAGAVAAGDEAPPDSVICSKSATGSISTFTSQESQSSGQTISMSSLTSPVLNEAEELRRQQLAIEREIKALEQQECQLLAVREIPDKPPPPYTPPADVRIPRVLRMFQVDDTIDDKVHMQLCKKNEITLEPNDVFDVFLQDFCEETINKQKLEQSDKPWDAYNLLPQKSPFETEKLAVNATAEVKELLSGLSTTAISGVGARRSDHIDDILFTEWRRCESEWTALHIDEAAIKNQIFEGIFQRILTEVIDEYKKTVHRTNETEDVQL